MDLTAIIRKGEKQFVALCPEVDVVSQGYTIEEAVDNLKEAVELYIEEFGVPEEIKGRIGLVVPDHKEIDIGTLREIIRQVF